MHPYFHWNEKWKDTLIEVEIEGETKDGLPHGLCNVSFVYNGEFENDWTPPQNKATS